MRVLSRDSASPTNHQPPDCKVGIWVAYPEAILLGQRKTGDDVAWSGMVKGAYWLRLRRQEARPRLTLAGSRLGGILRMIVQAGLPLCRSCRLASSSNHQDSNVCRARRSTDASAASRPSPVSLFLFCFRSRARRRAAVCLAYLEA
jgi:hypothetical protein